MSSAVEVDESADAMVVALRRFDERPTLEEFMAATGFSRRQIRSRYGTWGELVESVFKRPPNKTLTDIELAEDLLDVAETTDRVMDLRIKDYERYGEYHHQTVIKRFGSWSRAKHVVFEPRKYNRQTGEIPPAWLIE